MASPVESKLSEQKYDQLERGLIYQPSGQPCVNHSHVSWQDFCAMLKNGIQLPDFLMEVAKG